ncbi:MAG: transcription-repair coupling factor [Bacteroidales bacterium]|nr:transcription-repair coupling factor [Bacteroidales bacterium]
MLLTERYKNSKLAAELCAKLAASQARIHINGLTGSLPAVVGATLAQSLPQSNLVFIVGSKEDAYYLQNDLETLLCPHRKADDDIDATECPVMIFPTTYRRPYQTDETDNANVLMRSEVVKQLGAGRRMVVVSYPEALAEKVISSKTLTRNTLQIFKGSKLDMDFVIETLQEYTFERVDFVVNPGQFAVRGGIIDVFSYANEKPFRIEFFDDCVDSLRSFDPVTQLSIRHFDQVSIIPDLESRQGGSLKIEEKVNLLQYFGSEDIVWTYGLMYISETIEKCYATAVTEYKKIAADKQQDIIRLHNAKPDEFYSSANEFLKALLNCKVIETGNSSFFSKATVVDAHSDPQPSFNKQFELLKQSLSDYNERGYTLSISASSEQQRKRLDKIFAESGMFSDTITYLDYSLRKGFIDHDEHLLCYTDHEIFERYHKYTVRDLSQNREALTLKELFELKPGDYVTHIDYGVGRFSGLEKIETGGKQQEVIRLVYKNNDTLYISIHGLHKISRYVGKEGVAPTLNRLGSNTWQVLKQKTKKQVKDIARDLIQLYAKRKATRGFAFSADSYLQNELEASFMYEDTPDQLKATVDVKHDMESSSPMDRLVCGDVGFGKTEVAIRAAFKAVCDSKQVAVLVPSTILAFQHFNTFTERLKGLPVNIDYLNRFRTTKEKNQIARDLESGKLDILIGTHAITNSKLKFKDLGLLIVDEEQKFGVSVKEKLKQMRTNVDVLTLTATPIPRTLQFSLMGARDLSVIQTPPPNRQPIQTELSPFNEELIRDAISFELSRDGQVFFISNRVENLPEMAGLVSRLVPDARVAIAHGQMEGKVVEDTMMRFIEGEIDVLVSTAIIENGLDIPNANTMIINNAQQFGLSDLHQMRGRVGRSNRKAFCYMLVPSFSSLTDDAQKRLRAIEEFASVGSGFNIAMRDLDIRGAGNILGAEQSGFISEIGYDMYHKILNEAIEELKETDFRELFQPDTQAESGKRKAENGKVDTSASLSAFRSPLSAFVKECTIETDLEVLIPDDYVSNISERLQLYKELNDIGIDDKTGSNENLETQLDNYRERLIDRFGPIPPATQELIKTITLRRMAKNFGIEKLVLKQNKMVLYFPSNQQSPFYQSPNFTRLISYAQDHPRSVHLRETTDRLTLVCDNVDSIHSAIDKLNTLTQ